MLEPRRGTRRQSSPLPESVLSLALPPQSCLTAPKVICPIGGRFGDEGHARSGADAKSQELRTELPCGNGISLTLFLARGELELACY